MIGCLTETHNTKIYVHQTLVAINNLFQSSLLATLFAFLNSILFLSTGYPVLDMRQWKHQCYQQTCKKSSSTSCYQSK